jgi:glycerol uptake facilitator-like aquaporin
MRDCDLGYVTAQTIGAFIAAAMVYGVYFDQIAHYESDMV